MPDSVERVAAQDVDGVGLLRAEFILTDALRNRHPRDLIARGEQNTLVDAGRGRGPNRRNLCPATGGVSGCGFSYQ